MSKGTFVPKPTYETVLDVSAEKLAKVYARAALNAAGDLPAQQSLLGELDAVVSEVLKRHPDIEKVFGSLLIGKDEKLAMIDRVFGGRLSETAINFLKVLAKHGRLALLRQVVLAAGGLWRERCEEQSVFLELAHEADDSLREEILTALADTLGTHPMVTVNVNPDLIGGFVAKVGDRVYDASVRTSLEHTRQAMVERAVEAIQHHELI